MKFVEICWSHARDHHSKTLARTMAIFRPMTCEICGHKGRQGFGAGEHQLVSSADCEEIQAQMFEKGAQLP